MPAGKAAGQRCVHLDASARCGLFGDPRRPQLCRRFQPEPAVCGGNRRQAMTLLQALELETGPVPTRCGDVSRH